MLGESPILEILDLAFPWVTFDPFLFCVHHDDGYPRGNEVLGPAVTLDRRPLGSDFSRLDGWSMYHGQVVPGFPRHPHRGFETVTIVRRGFIDHSDSLGATARFGQGDTQWMTAGRGIEHSEMFPLLRQDAPNPVELFQIWLNLPRVDKMVEPYFTMLWNETIAHPVHRDAAGRATEVGVIAGALGPTRAPAPPPNSWAARPESGVAIWTIKMEPGATWTLPGALSGSQRTLYMFAGDEISVGGTHVRPTRAVRLRPEPPLTLENRGEREAEMLLLAGRPIGEPVVQHGPFVMNTRLEIQEAFFDYQRSRFGKWPWTKSDPVHPREEGRFARHPDGRQDRPPLAVDSAGTTTSPRPGAPSGHG